MRVCSEIKFRGKDTWLCLVLINTVENRNVEPVDDYLVDLPIWIDRLREWEVVTPAEASRWIARAKSDTKAAARILADIKRLREAMFRVFSTVADGGAPDTDDLALFNRKIAEVYSHLELTLDSGTPQWGWHGADENMAAPFWPAIHSAAQLLTSDELDRLRNCSGEKCTWLFMDRSKNRSRRWCTMDVCGNRAKSRRHYARVKKEATP